MDFESGYRADLAVSGETHDLDDGNHTVAVDFPHEVLDSYRTDWGKGCFDDSFARRLPVMVVNHNPDLLIGSAFRSENLGDRSRLVGRFANFEEVPAARSTFSLVRDGHYPGWSFHFRRGQTVAHPSVRGARRYVKADMLEFSPVAFPTIPGANAVGIRSEQEASAMDIETLLRLKAEGVLDAEGLRALIAEHYPDLRERIVVPSTHEPLEAVRAVVASSGLRGVVLRIDGDGGVSTADPGPDNDDVSALASAVDAALDGAAALWETTDVATLPAEVQQGIALVNAAGVAADELLSVMGIDDPDEGGRSEQFSARPWNFDAAAYTIEQLKRACLVVDDDGATKDDCHLPVREPDGTLNRAAVHAAAAALAGARGGVNLSDSDRHKAATTLLGLYAKLGEKPPASLLKAAGKDDSGSQRSETGLRALERLSSRFVA